MYNYGVEGEVGNLLQQVPSRLEEQLIADYSNIDGEPSPRGEEQSEFIHFFSSKLLRVGLTVQAVTLSLMFLFFWAFGGTGIFNFDIYSGPESITMSSSFHLLIALLTAAYLGGVILIAMFQVFIADNSKWCRGFRSGSKVLSTAVTLDIVSVALRLTQFLYSYNFSSVRWWARFQQTKADWALFHAGNIINATAIISYGAAFFFLEAYQDEGVGEEFGIACFILFTITGISELLMVFTGYGAFFSISLLISLSVAAYWSYLFEPLLDKWAPELHSRDINSDILPDVAYDEYGDAGKMSNMQYQNLGDANMVSHGGEFANGVADLPTTYDYSQINQPHEMGVIGTSYT